MNEPVCAICKFINPSCIHNLANDYHRCTCVAGGTGTARSDCVTATDEQFCRCVVSSGGDVSQVYS